jgi:hypothetical protein
VPRFSAFVAYAAASVLLPLTSVSCAAVSATLAQATTLAATETPAQATKAENLGKTEKRL